MAITASRYSLGMDREVMRETAASKGRASLMRKGLRQAKKEKNYDKALGFAAALEGEGQAYGMTGSAADASSIAQGRVASREALATQMRSQSPGVAGNTRESRVAAAKAAGTFDATREKYNKAAAASGKTMDEAGNIVDLPKETPGATPPSPTPGATPPAATPPAPAPSFNPVRKLTKEEEVDLKKPLPGLPAREKGGPVRAGKPYLVGEKGPEIVVPEEDGEVIPNKDLKKKKTRKLLQAALSKK